MTFLSKVVAFEKVAKKLLFLEFNCHLTQRLNLSTKPDDISSAIEHSSDEIYINPTYVNKNPRFVKTFKTLLKLLTFIYSK